MINRYLKKENRLKIPEYLYIILTENCPINCPQCYRDQTAKTDISMDIFIDTVSQAKDLGIKKIILIGGEPLIYPHINEVFKFIHKNDMIATFSTSGYNIKKVVDELKLNKSIYPFISLNGSTKEINDISRDGYQLSIEAMETLKRENIQFSVNWVARKSNVYDFPNLINLIFSIGAASVTILQSKLNSLGDCFDYINKENLIFLKNYISQSHVSDKIFFDRCCKQFHTELSNINLPELGYGCIAGEFIICVNSQGLYQPCPHLNLILKEKTLVDAWENSTLLNDYRLNKNSCIQYIN